MLPRVSIVALLAFAALSGACVGAGGNVAEDPTPDATKAGPAEELGPETPGRVAARRRCPGPRTPSPFGGDSACPAPSAGEPDALDAALAAEGLTRCDVRFDDAHVALSSWPDEALFDPRRLDDFGPLFAGPLRLPAYGRETASWLDEALSGGHPVSDALAVLAARRGDAIGGVCFEGRAPSERAPLARAVVDLRRAFGELGARSVSADGEAEVQALLTPLPEALEAPIASVVIAIGEAAALVREALAKAGEPGGAKPDLLARAASLYLPTGGDVIARAGEFGRFDAVDLAKISGAASLLARAVEDARLPDAIAASPAPAFAPIEIETPLGAIVIGGGGDDAYLEGSAAERAALLVDLGGADRYEVPAGASGPGMPVSVAIDLSGADFYGYREVPGPRDAGLLPGDEKGRLSPDGPPSVTWGPVTLSRTARQGAASSGIGMLFDLGTEGDVYRSLAASQGAGAMGVGLLYDAGGDDDYAAEAASQGAGVFGMGLLLDAGGSDRYASFHASQGFGGARGVGALVDGGGDDAYACDPGDPARGGHPLYFSSQLPGLANTSFCQGAGVGRRPAFGDPSDPTRMAGGLGILRDASGNDEYEAGVFAQGVGYWQGVGLLMDGAGDDAYGARWHAQGAAAHFALALLDEGGGDDTYDAGGEAVLTALGVGHDFSAGVHVDRGGDDVYFAPPLSLGTGNANGIGIFVNEGGDDHYEAAGDPTLGAASYSAELPASDPRKEAPTLGVFVDAGGDDAYRIAGSLRPLDDASWSHEPQPYAGMILQSQHGCGLDVGKGGVSLP